MRRGRRPGRGGGQPGRRLVYVANQYGDNVSQYDVGAGGALSPKSPATVRRGHLPDRGGGEPGRRLVYVANDSSDNVSQYDVGAGGALSPKSPATVAAGDGPIGVAVSPPRNFDVTAELGTSETPCLPGLHPAPDTEYTVRLCAASQRALELRRQPNLTTDPL